LPALAGALSATSFSWWTQKPHNKFSACFSRLLDPSPSGICAPRRPHHVEPSLPRDLPAPELAHQDSRPLITTSLEPAIYEFLEDRCRKTNGVYLHGIGGSATHVHMAVNIEPHVCISDLVGDLKGSCSREINERSRLRRLQWQRGFGVVSFGKKQLPWVLRYIAHQKEHHAAGRTEWRLERVSMDDDGTPLDG
jgi:putative transposase